LSFYRSTWIHIRQAAEYYYHHRDVLVNDVALSLHERNGVPTGLSILPALSLLPTVRGRGSKRSNQHSIGEISHSKVSHHPLASTTSTTFTYARQALSPHAYTPPHIRSKSSLPSRVQGYAAYTCTTNKSSNRTQKLRLLCTYVRTAQYTQSHNITPPHHVSLCMTKPFC